MTRVLTPRSVRTELEGDDIGAIYRLNASYYTVVATGRTEIEHGRLLAPFRALLVLAGPIAVTAATKRLAARLT